MSDSYKASKEAFVSGQTGSSIIGVNLVSSVAVASLVLHASVVARLHGPSNLILEWLLLVVPLLLSMTAFALQPVLLYSALFAAAWAIHFAFPIRLEDPPLLAETMQENSPLEEKNGSLRRISVKPVPALTIYRSHMMLMTVLAILAVDFPIFPRSLAKCETFGVSLMDIGVGSFVFSQGIISAIPMLKDPSSLTSPVIPKIIRVLKKTAPVVVLGLVRLISVKGTDYPEHESEYGRHWNFFFTMASIPILEVLLHKTMVHASISFIGFCVALGYQCALSLTNLQDYTLNAARTGLISANKEGLVSLPGYLAIHLIGLSLGTIVLPPSPSDFKRLKSELRKGEDVRRKEEVPSRRKKPQYKQNDKIAIEMFSYAALWWVALGVSSFFALGGGVSRRLANMPYVLWVCAYNTSFILCYLTVDLAIYSRIPSSQSKEFSSQPSTRRTTYTPSILLDAINLNGLALFLLANVLTGLVNLSIKTMYASDMFSLAVLLVYSFIICGVAWVTKSRRLWM